MKTNLFIALSVFYSSLFFAQKIELNGTVIDAATNQPISGANITIKNTILATRTDFDGSFKLSNVPVKSTVVISFVGYTTREITASSEAITTIKLQEDRKNLDEIVVVGYSSKKRKDVTGAVAVISTKTIDDLRPIKAEQALQGTVAGVSVSASSGAPGSGLNILIRGVSSNGANGPLVIIDGFAGALELLNPSDIESFTVLKDAQAAVYGSTGGNGVILVTTKQGRKNSKTKVTFNSYTGMQETSRKLNLLNATEYGLLLNESYANGGSAIPFPNVSNLGIGTNWQNEVFNKAPIYNNDILVNGGSESITYLMSASNLRQEGIVGGDKSGFNRSSVRMGIGVDISSKIKIKANAVYTDFNRQGLNEGGIGSVLFNAINVPATQNVFDSTGNYTLVPSTQGYGNEVINPLAQIDNTYNSYNLKTLSGTASLDYAAFKGFKFTSRIGFNNSRSKGKSFSKIIDYGPNKVFNTTRSSVSQSQINELNYTADIFAEYETTFADKHKIKLAAGTTIYETNSSGLFGTGYEVPYNSWEFADIALAIGTGGVGVRDTGSYEGIGRRLSYFATADYTYKGRYLLSGIIRRDGSLKFGPENKIGIFPSVLAGWIVSDESFLKDSKHINYLKLRASYGLLGNDQIGDFLYRTNLTGEATYVFNNALVNGVAIGTVPNQFVKWEADTKIDVGLDLKLLNNKIDITTDFFQNTRNDLLIPGIPVSGISGYNAPGSGAPTVNAGTVRNTGFEFDIKYKESFSDDFRFGAGFNFTALKNEVLAVDNSTGFLEGGSFGVGQSLRPTRMIAGQPLGVFYGFQADGIFQNQADVNAHPSQLALGANAVPGDIRFKDINGDGKIDANDRTYIGSPIADFTMGFNINFDYKNFDFVAYSFASIGNDMIRNYERTEANLNKLNYVLGRWTGEGTSNFVPRVTNGASANNNFSSYFVEDASFLRIQNIQLGYTFKNNFVQKAGISKVRLYSSVNNIYTFTKYKGFDPVANSGAALGGTIDYGFYPTPRIYMLGLNVNF